MEILNLDQIATQLKNKHAINPCPRCNEYNFSILGESEIVVKKSKGHGALGSLITTEMPISTVVVVCNNCGYIAQHALATLNTRPKGALSNG